MKVIRLSPPPPSLPLDWVIDRTGEILAASYPQILQAVKEEPVAIWAVHVAEPLVEDHASSHLVLALSTTSPPPGLPAWEGWVWQGALQVSLWEATLWAIQTLVGSECGAPWIPGCHGPLEAIPRLLHYLPGIPLHWNREFDPPGSLLMVIPVGHDLPQSRACNSCSHPGCPPRWRKK